MRAMRSSEQNPSRGQTGAMEDVMASGGLAWHQWKKHGRCSGLAATAYFEKSREAYGKINRPAVFRKLDKTVKIPARVVEEAFLEANPDLDADMITITCKGAHIQEARICFTKGLDLRTCGRDVIRDCSKSALFDPVR